MDTARRFPWIPAFAGMTDALLSSLRAEQNNPVCPQTGLPRRYAPRNDVANIKSAKHLGEYFNA
jgi:hypothetical protein